MSQAIHSPVFGPLIDPLLSIKRRSAACSAQQLTPAATNTAAARYERNARLHKRSYASVAATAVAQASPQVPAGSGTVTVAATPVRPDQPGLAADVPEVPFTVAYQGVPGAYSEVAALAALPGWRHAPCNNFELVFQSLTQWSADRAVLPIENSLGGSIHDNFDLMINHRLHIVAETLVDVNHCLLALPGAQKNNLRRVLSHPQALAQCDQYLRSLGTEGTREAVFDTAGAAQSIAANGWTDVGAIASARAAELYGLEILERSVQDNKDNVTRFIVLAREPLVIRDPQPGKYKTSIVFSLMEGPGMLYKAMSVFALRDINMTKIESRPLRSAPIAFELDSKRRSYNYLFFIDFNGSTAEVGVQNALKNLEEFATMLRVLGSYPKGN